MRDMPSPQTQQVMALACVLGTTIAVMRARSLLSASDTEAIFENAWPMLPPNCQGFGEGIMAVVRDAANRPVSGRNEPGHRSEP